MLKLIADRLEDMVITEWARIVAVQSDKITNIIGQELVRRVKAKVEE